VERQRPELAGEGAGVRRLDAAVAAPPGAGPHERAEADGEARRHAVDLAAPARRLPHRGRRRPPRGLRGGRAALVAAAGAVPLWREPPVTDHAAQAPRRRRRGQGGGRGFRRVLLTAARNDPGEPGMLLALLGASPVLVVRSVVVVTAEERGEHRELAGAPLLVLVSDVALLERAAAGGPHLRRPEEEQARVAPERAARRVRLPPGHVRRHRPGERRGGCRWRRRVVVSRRQWWRGLAVLRGGEHEQAVAEAGGADAAAGLERVRLAPHAHLLVVSPLLISSHLSAQVAGAMDLTKGTRKRLRREGEGKFSDGPSCAPAFPSPFLGLVSSVFGLGDLLNFGCERMAGYVRGSSCGAVRIWRVRLALALADEMGIFFLNKVRRW
jgi:hypothetical protein